MATEMMATKRTPSTTSSFVPEFLPRRSWVASPPSPPLPPPSQPLLPHGSSSTSSPTTPQSSPPQTIAAAPPLPPSLPLSTTVPPLSATPKIATTPSEGGKMTEEASNEPDPERKLMNFGYVVVKLFPVLELAKTRQANFVAMIIPLLLYGGSPSVVPYLLITLCVGLFALDFALSRVEMFPVFASFCGLTGKAAVLFVVPFIVSKNLSKDLAWIPLVCYAAFLIAQPIGGYIHMVHTNRKLRMKWAESVETFPMA